MLWMLSDLALRSLRLDRLIGSIAADLWPGQRDGIGSRSGSQDLKNGRRMGGSGQTRGSRLLPGQSGSQCVSLGNGQGEMLFGIPSPKRTGHKIFLAPNDN